MLDINRLARQGAICPGKRSGPNSIRWTYTYTGELVASGVLTSNLEGEREGWLRIQIGALDQWITLHRLERHFGGGQWYFLCPKTYRRCSVVWMPPGAKDFASRYTWRRQVAYRTQFQTRYERALSAGQSLRATLGGTEWAGYNGDDPPKPKRMRWHTYERILARSYRYEEIADEHTFALLARLGGTL